MTDKQAALDGFLLVEVGSQIIPSEVIEVLPFVEHVNSAEKRAVSHGPGLVDVTFRKPLDLRSSNAGPAAETEMVFPCVSAAAEMRYPEDDQLCVASREAPTGHEATGNASQPRNSRRWRPRVRRRFGAVVPLTRPLTDAAAQAMRPIAEATRRNSRRGHCDLSVAGCGWGVVKGAFSPRAICKASSTADGRSTVSAIRWATVRVLMTAATQRGA